MHFDVRDIHSFESVGDCNARMRIAGRIYHDPVDFFKIRLLDFVDNRALVIRLKALNVHALFVAVRLYALQKVVESAIAVYMFFAYSEHIDIWSVYHEQLHC